MLVGFIKNLFSPAINPGVPSTREIKDFVHSPENFPAFETALTERSRQWRQLTQGKVDLPKDAEIQPGEQFQATASQVFSGVNHMLGLQPEYEPEIHTILQSALRVPRAFAKSSLFLGGYLFFSGAAVASGMNPEAWHSGLLQTLAYSSVMGIAGFSYVPVMMLLQTLISSGHYSPRDKSITVPNLRVPKNAIAHEYAHYLQDEFLGAPPLSRALEEGHAMGVQGLFVKNFAPEESQNYLKYLLPYLKTTYLVLCKNQNRQPNPELMESLQDISTMASFHNDYSYGAAAFLIAEQKHGPSIYTLTLQRGFKWWYVE